MEKQLASVIRCLPDRIVSSVEKLPDEICKKIQEIRLHTENAVTVTVEDKNLFLCGGGTLSAYPAYALRTSAEDVDKTFVALCGGSVYTHETELKNGFISLQNGGRAGICGTAIYGADGGINGYCDITSINIRIPREAKGVAEPLKKYIFDGGRLNSVLIVSKPNLGKTTLLRDIAREVSGEGYRVCVVDERNEISATYQGVARNDVGLLTDVIVGVDKVRGMEQAVRTLSPQMMICDEIANRDEAEKLVYAVNSGVAVAASCHASDYKMLKAKGAFEKMLAEKSIRYIVTLSGLGKIGDVTEV